MNVHSDGAAPGHQGTRTPLLQLDNVSKTYGSVTALSDASFTLLPGECHALLGDNGAGKSTLIKIISGAAQRTSGSMELAGEHVDFATPGEAQAAGIETVYQDLSVALHLGAPENIFLGREARKSGPLGWLGVLDRRLMRARTAELLQSLNVKLQSLETPVGSYSGGQRQAVAIARAIAWGQRVLILDEPTAALGVPQKKMVLDLIRDLRTEQPELGIILITHDIPHVFAVADRATVLRQGVTAATFKTSETNEHELISAITGARA